MIKPLHLRQLKRGKSTQKTIVSTGPSFSSTHSISVDVLRGIAILIVVFYHILGPIFGFMLPWSGWTRDFSHPPTSNFFWSYPATFGWAGVSLFFVLSGFCIHASFLKAKEFNLPNFFWRRFWRIYPAYFVTLVVLFIVMGFDIFTIAGAYEFFAHALFLHNLRDSAFFVINPSFWSLAVEFQLYLLFPVLLIFRARFGVKNSLLILFIIGCIWRAIAVTLWGLPDHLITPALTSPFMTWFDWALGAYVAERFYQGRQAFKYHLSLAALAAALLVLSSLYKPTTIFSFTLAAVTSAIVLDWLIWKPLKMSAVIKGIAYTGLISYSVYLWHQPLLHLIYRSTSQLEAFLWIVPSMLATVIVSYLSFLYIEQKGLIAGNTLWRYASPFVIREKKSLGSHSE